LPDVSRRFYVSEERDTDAVPTSTPRIGKKTTSASLNSFLISGKTILTEKLEAPYDTKCTKGLLDDDFECTRKCREKMFRKENLVGPDEITWEPVGLRHFNFADIQNKSLLDIIDKGNEFCAKKCNRKSCRTWYTITNVRGFHWMVNESVSLSSRCDLKPSIIVSHQAKLVFLDFFIYISSSIGVWFGMSIIKMNPFIFNRKSRLPSIISNSYYGIEKLLRKKRQARIIHQKHVKIVSQQTRQRVMYN